MRELGAANGVGWATLPGAAGWAGTGGGRFAVEGVAADE